MILGIDQSIESTGLCLIDNNLEILHKQLITTDKTRGVKLNAMVTELIIDLLNSIDHKSDLIITREDYSYGSKSNSTYQIGELGGCILHELFKFAKNLSKDSEIHTYCYKLPPTTHKKFCLGNGQLKKDTKYLLTIYKEFGIEFEADDIADAYMLSLTGYKMHQIANGNTDLVKELSEKQREAVVPEKFRKRKGLTPKKFRAISEKEVCSLVKEVLNSIYFGFKV